ncbi:MAG: glycosyltransferase family 2 protein [Chloroherpetonaceae bacterium]|nr:glycosyltransferase family 2 protein [Chloroherpetonaceae bacterium]MDW8437130.1 glycosyltransferase family 2 protein [Chloroherpetonaceae bacterium]
MREEQSLQGNEAYPKVDIIIPHHNGTDILLGCLSTLSKTTYPNFLVTIVDNGTTDESLALAQARFPSIQILRAGRNLGYAGGCNFGFERTSGKYVVFLNNDTEQEPNWLSELVALAETDEEIASLQPKLLSIQARNRGEKVFDYAGAAGGMMDKLGYPYCLGRVLDEVETDCGQYDKSAPIFWTSGAAMFARRSALEKVGTFDEDFFAHMEEIDLCWRLWKAGFWLRSAPKSIVYHYGGATLSQANPRKAYLNHRNNVMMLTKNADAWRLYWLLPLRFGLELAAILFYLKSKRPDVAKAALDALVWNVKHFIAHLKKRRALAPLRKRSDGEIFKRCRSETAIALKTMLTKK